LETSFKQYFPINYRVISKMFKVH